MRAGRLGAAVAVLGSLVAACADHGEPGVGYSVNVPFEVVASGSAPMTDQGEARLVVAGADGGLDAVLEAVPQAEEQLSTADIEGKALVVVLGGCQPDSAYALEVTSLVLGYGEVSAVGRVTRGEGVGLQVLSVPYQVLAVDPGRLTVTKPGLLTLEGADGCGNGARYDPEKPA